MKLCSMLVIGMLAVATPAKAGDEHAGLAIAYYGSWGALAVSAPLFVADFYFSVTGLGITPQYGFLEVVVGLGCIGLGSYVLFSNHAGSPMGAAPIALGLGLAAHGIFAERRPSTDVTVGSPPERVGLAPWVAPGGGGFSLVTRF